MKKFASITLLTLSAIVLGICVGVLSAAFLRFIDWGQQTLWYSGRANFKLAPLIFCSLGGLLVGLCLRYLGNHPKGLQSSVKEIGTTGRLDYSTLPRGLVTVAASLIFGASLGPEAAIVSLLGGLGTWGADRLRWLRNRLGIAQPSTEGKKVKKWLRKWANALFLTVAFVIFILGVKDLYSGGFLTMNESPAWIDLLWSLPLACLGFLLGLLYQFLTQIGEKQSARFQAYPILKATLAGIILGIAATALPMILFSGQHDLQTAYNNAALMGAPQLLVIGLTRLVLVALLLVSGWKGGQFLPLMFATTALGLGMSQLLPAISAPTGILAVMSGLLVVILPNPIMVLALMALMFPWHYLGTITAAILAASGINALWKHFRLKSAAPIPQPSEAE